MKKYLSLLAVLVVLLSIVAGCSSDNDSSTSSNDGSTINTESDSANENATDNYTSILLDDGIGINGDGAKISDDGVTITSAGTYTISGVLEDGMIEIDAPNETVNLILEGVTITNSNGPAILFKNALEAIVTLEADSENVLSDGGDSDYDGALYSTSTMTIKGEGNLTVIGNNEEGIASEMHLNIEGGNIWVSAADDGLNANNDNVSIITISGGYLYVDGGGDGIDSNGSIEITGGTVIAMSALTDANGGLDADGDVTITGGTVIATGARLSLPSKNSEQKSIFVNFGSTQAANTLVSIQNDSNDLLTFAPAKEYQSLLYSSSILEENISYDVYIGGSAEGEGVDGLYINAVVTPDSLIDTVTTDSLNNANQGGRPMDKPNN